MSTSPPTQLPIAQRHWQHKLVSFIVRPRFLWLALAAVILVLFPFDWLGNIWPAYAQIFDVVFATALAHMIGHATHFFIASLLVLLAFPRLRYRPVPYFTVMIVGAVGEESLQSLFKLHLPTIWDGRDLLLDLVGITVGYIVVRLWILARQRFLARNQ